MVVSPTLAATPDAETGPYKRILVALDSSDHANRGITEAVALAALSNAEVTGTHVYAAKLHDLRFRQMEGGLPEKFREEQVLEQQRDVHDDLITRGLSIITDSYLDQAERLCAEQTVPFARCSLEGKNYRELVNEAKGGGYSLLVMGALGVGAISGSRLGTVAERVARRSSIDTLVIKDAQRSIAKGPIVVAVDGSSRAYGGLITALYLAGLWKVSVQVVAAFDPYYHYVAFNRIAGVLSEEASQVFKFQEQEKLHEEIIDSGLAKIYEGHLSVAKDIAKEQGVEIETVLLDGKPYDAIEKQLRKVQPSLLVIGKTGIHADPELDIGGNAENLLRNVDCSVLLTQREHQPKVDVVAAVTTSWTQEAEQRMERVPSFVKNMARMAILRYAQEQGHTVITEKIVEEATAQLMPGHAERAMAEIVAAHDAKQGAGSQETGFEIRWSDEAKAVLLTVEDLALRGNLSMRAEKKARAEKSSSVEKQHIAAFMEKRERKTTEEPLTKGDQSPETGNRATPRHPAAAALEHPYSSKPETELHWQAAALARLMRVPEGFMRNASRERIEDYARRNGVSEITLEVAEQGLAEARQSMADAMKGGAVSSPHLGHASGTASGSIENPAVAALEHPYSSKSEIESAPHKCPVPNQGIPAIESAEGSGISWAQAAEYRLEAVPEGFCRDMTRKAAETIAGQSGLSEIDSTFLEQILKTFEAGAKSAGETLPWNDEARARIEKAPEMVRGMLIKEIEGWALRNSRERVDQEAVDAVKVQWQERGVFHLDPTDPRSGKMTDE
ncbi:MAG: universal stress protein [Gammaproteobacteria bacterium]|nr:universal stress protein [Gammaproteobacteria bacterium]